MVPAHRWLRWADKELSITEPCLQARMSALGSNANRPYIRICHVLFCSGHSAAQGGFSHFFPRNLGVRFVALSPTRWSDSLWFLHLRTVWGRESEQSTLPFSPLGRSELLDTYSWHYCVPLQLRPPEMCTLFASDPTDGGKIMVRNRKSCL